jgi:hypothetical protein
MARLEAACLEQWAHVAAQWSTSSLLKRSSTAAGKSAPIDHDRKMVYRVSKRRVWAAAS